VIEGDIASLVIPVPGPSQRADELWRSTCAEMFVAPSTGGYREFNFSPAGLWASYEFSGYRDGMTMAQTPPPELAVRQTEELLIIDVEIERVRGAVALAAVLEGRSGAICYWALAHPSDKPDFHHPDSFVLDLP
jgi:hypothetical protein